MRIGIDARMYDESGVGRYIRNLLVNLQKLDDKNEYFIFLLDKNFISLTFKNNFKKVKANFKWYGLSEQLKFPKLLSRYKLDLVHFPHFNVPIFYNDSWSSAHQGKFVVTIHDLIHQHFEMRRATTHDPLVYKIKQFGYKKIFNNAIKKSQKILTPSKFVKDQLTSESEVNEKKIIVTPEAVDDRILTIVKNLSQKNIDQALDHLYVKRPFIFYVGNAHPHKNVEELIRAFRVVRENHKELSLVLSGNDHYFWQRIKKELGEIPTSHASLNDIKGARNDVIFTGFISDEELVALYKSAKAFVMPSFEEGFGIPLLEAFACGCPVVSSNAGSLPEVGGDACLYFDPKSINDIGNKISEVLNDNKLRSQMVKKGEQRYKQFSWEKLGEQTLNVYKDAV